MTRIQAHRGASAERPENTMAAFRRAVELGADGIELDVHLLRDGVLAVHHDAVLGRCETGLEGSIYHYTMEELRTADAGGKFDGSYAGERIPDFQEVLELLAPTSLVLNVEIKAGTGFLTEVGEKTVQLLREYGMEKRCILSSFNHAVLLDIKQKHPDLPVGALYSEDYGLDMVDYARRYGFDALHSDYRLVDANLVERAHAAGIAVNVWTVDAPADIRRMFQIGVDTVISNDPAQALQLAGR